MLEKHVGYVGVILQLNNEDCAFVSGCKKVHFWNPWGGEFGFVELTAGFNDQIGGNKA
jgi:hypothetical protein